MRVLLIGVDWDNGGLFNSLAKAFRNVLGIDAMQLVGQTSYLGYDYDWKIGEVDPAEVMDYAKDCDFFIFEDVPFSSAQFPFSNYLRPGNCCICGTGTGLFVNMDRILQTQLNTGIPVLLPLKSGEQFYHKLMITPLDFVIIDTKRISDLTRGIKRNDVVTFCHSPTSTAKKGTSLIDDVIGQFHDLSYEYITGKSWEEAIKAKARSHVLINSVGGRTYGLNCLEGLAMGQQVITDLGPWTFMMHPDIPMTTVNPLSLGRNYKFDGALYDMRAGLAEAIQRFKSMDPDELYNERGVEWVEKQNSAEAVCERWKWFFRMMLRRGDIP